ncbi:MAG: hypothetical protein ABI307_03655 [Mycobacterium sp.]
MMRGIDQLSAVTSNPCPRRAHGHEGYLARRMNRQWRKRGS